LFTAGSASAETLTSTAGSPEKVDTLKRIAPISCVRLAK
jgi:hypothetical protein